MQVRKHGVRTIEGQFAIRHLDTDKVEVQAVDAEVFEIDLSDEKVDKGQFVALLSRELIFPGVSRPATDEEKGNEVIVGSRTVWIEPPVARWHMSIEGRRRTATADEAYRIATRIRPGVMFVLRPNPKPGTLHLWEISDPHLEELWRE
jgi:hypothetical protein